jgi:hypothetical protein
MAHMTGGLKPLTEQAVSVGVPYRVMLEAILSGQIQAVRSRARWYVNDEAARAFAEAYRGSKRDVG